jgi:hypothetical protein
MAVGGTEQGSEPELVWLIVATLLIASIMIFRGRRRMNWRGGSIVTSKADQMEPQLFVVLLCAQRSKDITQLPALMSWVWILGRQPG